MAELPPHHPQPHAWLLRCPAPCPPAPWDQAFLPWATNFSTKFIWAIKFRTNGSMRRQNCCCFPYLSLWGQEWFGFSELSPCFKVLPAAPGKHQYREMLCRHFLPSAPVGCYLSGRCHWAVPQQNLQLSFGCKARSLNKGTLLFEGTSSCFSHCF